MIIIIVDCLWSQKLCFKSDPRYEACRNWFYSVFNHFWVCWIQCRAVPSSTIYAKARILRFKIGRENRSKISQKTKVSASYEPVQDTYMLLYMWPTGWGVLKLILQCFKKNLSMLNLMPSGAKINDLCTGSNFTI